MRNTQNKGEEKDFKKKQNKKLGKGKNRKVKNRNLKKEAKERDNKKLKKTQYGRKVKTKVKCTLVQTLRLCTGRTAHRGSRGVTLLFLDHGTRRG